ncbi:hypothetical protein Tco_0691802 [Tanacetum coccineum]
MLEVLMLEGLFELELSYLDNIINLKITDHPGFEKKELEETLKHRQQEGDKTTEDPKDEDKSEEDAKAEDEKVAEIEDQEVFVYHRYMISR